MPPRTVLLLTFSLAAAAWASPRQASASIERAAVEAPRPEIDLEAAVDRAFTRFAEAGPAAFAESLARFDHAGAFAVKIAGLEERWAADAVSGFRARAERIKSETVGGSVTRFHYLLCLPRKPVIASLTCVRLPERGWLIRAFQFSDELATRRDLFRDAFASGDFTDPDRIVSEFAKTLPSDCAGALRQIVEHVESDADSDKLEQWVVWMTSMRTALGYRDRQLEPVAVEALSPSLIRYALVETTPGNFGVWELFFYRSSQSWTIPAFRCELGNDQTLELLFPGSSANPPTSDSASAPAPRR